MAPSTTGTGSGARASSCAAGARRPGSFGRRAPMAMSASPTASPSSPRPTRSSRVPSWPSPRTPTGVTPAGGTGSVA
eukprot:998881-Alexandrium_andersonii.AAC.1